MKLRFLLLALLTVPMQGQELQIAPYRFQTADGQSVEAELGHLSVLENRSKPEGATHDFNLASAQVQDLIFDFLDGTPPNIDRVRLPFQFQ